MEVMSVYRELDSVRIPEDVPELGVKAGDSGVIVNMWEGEFEGRRGTWLLVEMPLDDGTSSGFVDLEVRPDGSVAVVGHWKLS
jgi:hypothetical protein